MKLTDWQRGKISWLTWQTIKALVQYGDSNVHFAVQNCKTLFCKNQKSDATCLVGLSKPELPSHLTTSGTGFTAALWEQSRVPLRTVFGWPLSYVTDQFWKTWCVCAFVGKHFGEMDVDVRLKCFACSWKEFYDSGVGKMWFFWWQSLKMQFVPDSFIDGCVIGMAAHSSSIEGQHLKQQNISLCGWKARIWVSKNEQR